MERITHGLLATSLQAEGLVHGEPVELLEAELISHVLLDSSVGCAVLGLEMHHEEKIAPHVMLLLDVLQEAASIALELVVAQTVS